MARTEHLTFICAPNKDDVGPTNNWMDPEAAKYKVGALLDGAMRGRTMYVVPYIMGPAGFTDQQGGRGGDGQPVRGGEHADHGAHGQSGALDRIGDTSDFVPGLHSLGDLDPTRRYIAALSRRKN